ncbi:MAG: helix-turn-helix transcriptional regulator [Cyclobacteriaceae bacterium]
MESNKEIFQTLAAFFKSIGLTLKQDEEFTINSLKGLHGKPPIQSPAFRTNYFAFLLIEDAHGSYKIDNLQFELKPKSFYFTLPGHLKSFNLQKDSHGYMITFSEKFLRQFHAGDLYKEFPFLLAETVPVMDPPKEVFDDLKLLYTNIQREYVSESSYKYAIIGNLLFALLLKVKELLKKYQHQVSLENRSGEIVRLFKQSLDTHLRSMAAGNESMLNVKNFADELNISQDHLSKTIKSETGKTVSSWIDERLIAEAQSLLIQTGLPVNDIAYRLTFREPTNFTKYFKKFTGHTPKAYRDKFGSK